MHQVMPVRDLVKAIDVFASDRLQGWEWFRHKLAIIGAQTMNGMGAWVVCYMGDEAANQAWYNILTELRAIQRTLQRANIQLPGVLQHDLDYYCSLPPSQS